MPKNHSNCFVSFNENEGQTQNDDVQHVIRSLRFRSSMATNGFGKICNIFRCSIRARDICPFVCVQLWPSRSSVSPMVHVGRRRSTTQLGRSSIFSKHWSMKSARRSISFAVAAPMSLPMRSAKRSLIAPRFDAGREFGVTGKKNVGRP